ncbi:MAG TPA: FtsX-like permease family protein [Gammaproteobacteria bacterium]|nr:FtsX-like permease family protein [Gammaproteobacteria bacterium]
MLIEIASVTAMNLRSVPQRIGSSSVIVVAFAVVVAVLLSVFALTRSLSGAVLATGSPDRAIVLRAGATGEFSSTLLVDAVATIKDAPGIARTDDGRPAATADFVAAVNLIRKEDGARAGLAVRGVDPAVMAVRPEIKIVSGRSFTPGLRELIVGRSALGGFQDVAIGDEVLLRDGRWTVVGVFESGADANESGFLTDSATLLSAYQRTAVNSVTVRLASPDAYETFKTALTTNPTLSVSVERETDFYRRQSQEANQIFGLVSIFVGGFMGLGAIFAALNAMYSAVSVRTREIATLRAIGFGASGVIASVLVEALLLALIGAVVGAAISWLLYNGNTVNLGDSTSSIVFKTQVTPALLMLGVLLACALGFIGGLLPAVRAARLQVATALRAV